MKRAGLIVAWIAAAALLSTAAYQIVAAAESQVSDQALTPIVAITTDSVATSTADTSPTSTGPGQTTSTVSSPSTTIQSTTSTTTGSSTTTTPSPTSTAGSTSTTAGSAWTSRTVPSAGGDVVIEYRTGEVRLVVARPAAGYRVEVEAAGPPSVEVEFEDESTEKRFKIRARWQDGVLSITVDED